jgi:hypothetical protein
MLCPPVPFSPSAPPPARPQDAYPNAPGKQALAPIAAGAAAGDTNPLNITPVAPRFHYLPISAPVGLPAASAPGAAARSRAAAAAAAALGGAAAAALQGGAGGGAGAGFVAAGAPLAAGERGPATAAPADLAALYSFADLGTRQLAAAHLAGGAGAREEAGSVLADAADAGAAMAAGATAALTSLQAKLQSGGLGVLGLGSSLADRAAEVSAMAQNIGSIGDVSQLAGGLLSSFTRR